MQLQTKMLPHVDDLNRQGVRQCQVQYFLPKHLGKDHRGDLAEKEAILIEL